MKSTYISLILKLIIIENLIKSSESAITDYLTGLGEYFGYKKRRDIESNEFLQHIPYEVSEIDEKFLSEAAKLTGVALTELDTCQQKVVLKLQTDCNKMNDEQLAKVAVHLLNCQSFVEGRKIYPCTDDMTIRDCTINMDSDTWTSYHLMSNRARAVCYTIRQSQFRGLAEHTVNRLMQAAQDQLETLIRIAAGQENLQNLAEETYNSLEKGQNKLFSQQKDLQQAQFHGQLMIEDNINRLVNEKKLIFETHNKLIEMTNSLQSSITESAKKMKEQDSIRQTNHEEILEDLIEIQKRTKEIFDRIDEYSTLLMRQNEEFKQQYKATLNNLREVNSTLHNLLNLANGMRQLLEERLSWITTMLGGTDKAVLRLLLILWHIAFILIAMLCCVFLNARKNVRLMVASIPPINLIFGLYFDHISLNPFFLAAATIFCIIVYKASEEIKTRINIRKTSINNRTNDISNDLNSSSSIKQLQSDHLQHHFNYKTIYSNIQEDEPINEFTPPASRADNYSIRSRSRSNTPFSSNGSRKALCHGSTRQGVPCKLTSLPGKDYCYKHQIGS